MSRWPHVVCLAVITASVTAVHDFDLPAQEAVSVTLSNEKIKNKIVFKYFLFKKPIYLLNTIALTW